MKIAFYIENPAYRWMLEIAALSAKRCMPNALIVQVSPECFPIYSHCIDRSIIFNPGDANFLGRYFTGARHVAGDVLYANVDMIFHASLEHVFNNDEHHHFDLAIPHIASPDVNFDGALIFARNGDPLDEIDNPALLFWKVLAGHPVCRGPERPIIEQLRWINDCIDAFPGKKTILPGSVYSYVPMNAGDACFGAKVVHYRGNRKPWMAKAAGIAYDERWSEGRLETHPGLKEKAR